MESVSYSLWTSTSVSVQEGGQDLGVNMRTAVSLVPALMVARAPLSLKVATNVPALPATQVLDALTTRMNVLPHLLSAKMKASASTHLAPTSVFVPLGLLADSAKAHTSHAHHHHVLMGAPATRALKQATHATVCQGSMGLTAKTTLTTVQAISVLMEEPVWMESTLTTVSVLQSGLVSTVLRMWMSVVYSLTLAKMGELAAT